MATNSHVGIKLPENKVKWIYVHNDGYREHMFPTLSENYNTVEKVNALLDFGDASVIEPTLEASVFYARDLGECLIKDGIAAKTCPLNKWEKTSYNWLFDPETLKWERY